MIYSQNVKLAFCWYIYKSVLRLLSVVFMSPQPLGGGHIAYGADPVGVGDISSDRTDHIRVEHMFGRYTFLYVT